MNKNTAKVVGVILKNALVAALVLGGFCYACGLL